MGVELGVGLGLQWYRTGLGLGCGRGGAVVWSGAIVSWLESCAAGAQGVADAVSVCVRVIDFELITGCIH